MQQPARGGITWTIAGERIAVLTWPRAILLQLAHPLVAAGVGAHSGFRSSTLAPVTRLHATVTAMRHLAFGSPAQAEAARTRILRTHDRVHGSLGAAEGAFPAGTRYSAHDPTLLLWVHATLLDSHVALLQHVLRPFTPAELDAYCRESAVFAEMLGADARDVPRSWAALQAYIADEITSARVNVGTEARALARAVLRPTLVSIVPPLAGRMELITAGLLPDDIRRQYGFVWDERRERRLTTTLGRLQRLRQSMPVVLARWPEAR